VRVPVARKEGHAPEGHEWSTAVVATDAAAQDGRAQPTRILNFESPECGVGSIQAAISRPPGTLLKPRTKRLVMGPVLVCVRADPTATHVLIRYRTTYGHLT
jgi:hypothetical protein